MQGLNHPSPIFFFLLQGCYVLRVISTLQITLCNFRISNRVDIEYLVLNVVFSSLLAFNVFTGNVHFLHFIEHPLMPHWMRDLRLKNKNEQDWFLPPTSSWSRQFTTWCAGERMAPKPFFFIRRKRHNCLQASLNVWLSNHFSGHLTNCLHYV